MAITMLDSNVGHSVGPDTDWADDHASRSAHVSRGSDWESKGISLDIWNQGKAKNICGKT